MDQPNDPGTRSPLRCLTCEHAYRRHYAHAIPVTAGPPLTGALATTGRVLCADCDDDVHHHLSTEAK
jgi:hypothetical protein